jgi:L,D-peptidoglycan transpeptidase YkuD (ErfK/YbiS/YcfS/YnhG family)
MKLSKRVYIIISIFSLVAIIAISAYVKSTFDIKKIELQNSNKIAANIESNRLYARQTLKNKQRLEGLKKVESQKRLIAAKKLKEQEKLETQKNQVEIAKQKLASAKNETSSLKQTKVKTTSIPTKSKSELLVEKIKGKGDAEQAIVVTTNGFGSVNATITTYENSNGVWKQVHSYDGNIGKAGFTYNKVEGDGHSPIGVFSLGTAFGRYSNPDTSINYKQSTTNDFWVDDVNSPLYNTWQKGPIDGRWNSAEKMYIPQYDYGFVINYNTSSRVPGKGSAIFFHVWSGYGHGTAGCTATAEANVISILKWLNPSKNPVIIEGPLSEVIKM